jgi:hypothetical protein
LPAYRLTEIARVLHEFVENEGEIDEQVETRPESVAYEFHYHLRLSIDSRRLYFETLLILQEPK